VPPQAQLGEPRELGVFEQYFVPRLVRQLEESRSFLEGLHDQREYVEGSPLLGRLPATLDEFAGERLVAGIPEDRPVGLLVPGVPDELLVPDPGGGPGRGLGGEHADHRPDLPAVVCHPQMVEAVPGDLGGVGDGPQIAHLQAVPVQPSDAAGVVAPGDPGAEGQLLGRMPVGPGQVDLAHHRDDPLPEVPGLRVLGVEEFEELLGFGAHGFVVGAARASFATGPAHGLSTPHPDPSGAW
jgi:hypothetical protein